MTERPIDPGSEPPVPVEAGAEGCRNRLAGASSLYLRRHADHPVPWWPWGPEAFREARRRDVPILLSIGYSSCHWCHVMERESFRDEEVARVLAEEYVPIKVDREDRPDVDAFHLQAVQAMTGTGGWPLTVFLTPEGVPFLGGTYFPRPTFLALLREVARRWSTHRESLVQHGRRVLEEVRRDAFDGLRGTPGPWDLEAVLRRIPFDPVHGGIGRPVKFPQVPVLDLVLGGVRRLGAPWLARELERTLLAMETGGIRDLVGGGFHRYATEATWSVPHFEKMLYDNAMLARLYVEAANVLPARKRLEAVARDTMEWLVREMLRPDDLFLASVDADDPVGEGAFYLWTDRDLEAVLGAEGARRARSLLDDGSGRFGASFLPSRRGIRDPEDEVWIEGIRPRLREARSLRPAPVRDPKVVLEWNALTLSALVACGLHLERPDWLALAERTAHRLVSVFRPQGRIEGRVLNGTVPEGLPTLADGSLWALALIDLHGASGDRTWADLALDLAREIRDRWHGEDGVPRMVPNGITDLPCTLPASPQDHPTPSGLGSWARLLVRLEAWTGERVWTETLDGLIQTFAGLALEMPQWTPWTILAMEERSSLWTAVLAGDARDPRSRALAWTFLRGVGSGGILTWRGEDPSEGDPRGVAEGLAGGLPLQEPPTIHLCRPGACLPPVQDPREVTRALRIAGP